MTVTIEEVEAYLSEHPEAVLSLKLKSTEGSNTISFAERRAEALEERLAQTQAKLQELIDVSKDNERLFQACKTCLIELIESRDINALARIIERSLGEAFSVYGHHLFLFEDGEVSANPDLTRIDQSKLSRQMGSLFTTSAPWLGAIRPYEAKTIFPNAKSVASAAIVPIRRKKQLIGLFCLGSAEGNHFHAQLSTHFLELLADVIAWITPRADTVDS